MYYKNNSEAKKIIDEIVGEIIKETPDWKKLLKDKGLVDELTVQKEFRNLNTTQLRKFFDEVKNIEYKLQQSTWQSVEADLWKLVPSIKYAAGRGNVPQVFAEFVSTMVEKISDSNDPKQIFLNFERVFESIVAYHKYHGGK